MDQLNPQNCTQTLPDLMNINIYIYIYIYIDIYIFLFFIPMSISIAWDEVGGFVLFALIYFFFFT